jgi:hypothetical protein
MTMRFKSFEEAETAARKIARKKGMGTYILRLTPTSSHLTVLTEAQWLRCFPESQVVAGYDRIGCRWDTRL